MRTPRQWSTSIPSSRVDRLREPAGSYPPASYEKICPRWAEASRGRDSTALPPPAAVPRLPYRTSVKSSPALPCFFRMPRLVHLQRAQLRAPRRRVGFNFLFRWPERTLRQRLRATLLLQFPKLYLDLPVFERHEGDRYRPSLPLHQLRDKIKQPVQLALFLIDRHPQRHKCLRGRMQAARSMRGPLHDIGQMTCAPN